MNANSSDKTVLVVLAVAKAIAWVKKLLPVACIIAWGLACFKIKETEGDVEVLVDILAEVY